MSHRASKLAQACRRLARDSRGALAVEYVVVTMVGLMVATALVGLGAVMVDAWGRSINVIYSEHP
jgi:Flp pilus assembly pilin Flp